MQQAKKSRKISILAVILILLAGVLIGGYLVLKSSHSSANQLASILGSNSSTTGDCQPDPNNPDKDSDNDGLKDWQEIQIYKTDPCKADTDGDGYLDGEEIASGYDPTKKAPGDELPGTQHKTPRALPQNLTEALRQNLSEQLFQNSIGAFSTNGGLLSSEQLAAYPGLNQIVGNMTEANSHIFDPDQIDESQIKTTSDNSRQAILNYAASAAASFSYSETQSQSETEMFSNAVEKNDFSELESHLQNYKNAYERLKKLTVPSELVDIHKKQLEIISKLIKIYEAIKDLNNDPLKANLALQSYQDIAQQIANWLQKLSEFITAHP